MKYVFLACLLMISIYGCSTTERTQVASDEKLPCGLQGNLQERIADCGKQKSSVLNGFILVSRTKELAEVHFDSKANLLWGDHLPTYMDQYKAEKACNAKVPEVANITEVEWRLPTIEEFKKGNINGFRKVLPNMNYWYWTSTLRHNYPYYAWLFDGSNGNSGVYRVRNYDDNSVRCVATVALNQ